MAFYTTTTQRVAGAGQEQQATLDVATQAVYLNLSPQKDNHGGTLAWLSGHLLTDTAALGWDGNDCVKLGLSGLTLL